MTAAVVVRGFLRDQFGVQPEEIFWKIGKFGGGMLPDLSERAEMETLQPPKVTSTLAALCRQRCTRLNG